VLLCLLYQNIFFEHFCPVRWVCIMVLYIGCLATENQQKPNDTTQHKACLGLKTSVIAWVKIYIH